MDEVIVKTIEIKDNIAEIYENNRNLTLKIKNLKTKMSLENEKILKRVDKFEEYFNKIENIKVRVRYSEEGLAAERDKRRHDFDLEFQAELKNLWTEFDNKKKEIERKETEYKECIKKVERNVMESPTLLLNPNQSHSNVIIVNDILSCKDRCNINDFDQSQEEILTDYTGCRYRVALRPNGTYKRPSWGKMMGVGIRLIDSSNLNFPIKRKIEIRLKDMKGGPDFLLAKEENFYKIGFFCWFHEFISIDELFGNTGYSQSKYLLQGAIQLHVLFDGR